MRFVSIVAAAWLAASAAFAQDFTPTPPPPAPDGVALPDLLPALIEHSRHTARFENGRLTGEGAALLRGLAAQSQFVLIGESHGSSGVAAFAEAYWRDLREVGFGYAALELDPYGAAALERELRAGGVSRWGDFARTHGGVGAAAFATWAPEAQLANTIVSTAPRVRGPVIWGLDQVFWPAAPWLVRDIASSAHDARARALAAQLADQMAPAYAWIGLNPDTRLVELRSYLNHRRDRDEAVVVDAILESQRLYWPQLDYQGEAFFSNADREQLMKRNFLNYYRQAERETGEPPRVMVKVGSNHGYRGPTPLNALGLGGFLAEFATVNGGGGALNVAVYCGPGARVASLEGGSEACDSIYESDFAFLAPYIDRTDITVFDLRTWRLRLRRWQHLPADVRQFIASYDVFVVVPNGAASEFLPDLAPLARRQN